MPVEPAQLQINSRADVEAAKDRAGSMAEELGFTGRKNDIRIALAELCTNLLDHSEGGTVSITPGEVKDSPSGESSDRPEIKVTVKDSGPGIFNVKRAFNNGFSRSEGRGEGLGKVNQAVDELDIATGPEGTEITVSVRKTKFTETSKPTDIPIDLGFATRRHPAMKQNGDAFLHKYWDDKILVGIIDGVGHGKQASLAAMKAREYIESHYEMDFEAILLGANRACRGTRGAVVGLARFSIVRDEVKVRYTGVGNIECSIISGEEKKSLVSKRGLLGKSLPSLQIISRTWSSGDQRLMVLQSDGVKSHWSAEDFSGILDESGPEIANNLLKELARTDDDATVVAVKHLPGE